MGLELMLSRQAFYHLSQSSSQIFFVFNIFELGSHELFVWDWFRMGLTLNCDLPDLCLLSR
jgi:hypothetical protein